MMTLHGEHEERMTGVNRRSAESVRRSADRQRSELIDAAFEGFTVHLEWQLERMRELEAAGTLGKAAFDRTVLFDNTRLPFDEDGSPEWAARLLLRPDENLGQERKGEEKMMVFIPVPDEIVLGTSFDPKTLERPAFIVIERFDADGVPASYVVTDLKIEDFQSAYHTGEQRTGEELEMQQFVWRALQRVDPLDAVVGPMMTDLTNWTVQVQRSDEPDVQ